MWVNLEALQKIEEGRFYENNWRLKTTNYIL